jgi:arylsulfatase A-like enzyme
VGVPLPEEEETSGKSFRELLENPNATGRREAIYLEFHGIRFLYSQRAMVTADGWKYVFTPGDRDEVYDLNKDPGELQNLKDDPACSERSVKLQNQLLALAEAAVDPLAPCIAKYFGQWKRSNNQPDPTAGIGG